MDDLPTPEGRIEYRGVEKAFSVRGLSRVCPSSSLTSVSKHYKFVFNIFSHDGEINMKQLLLNLYYGFSEM